MAGKDIEDKIREYYLDDGEWLVEKGKVKEARLLKEAYTRIKKLKTENAYLSKHAHDLNTKLASLEREIEQRESNVAAREGFLQRKLKAIYDLMGDE